MSKIHAENKKKQIASGVKTVTFIYNLREHVLLLK